MQEEIQAYYANGSARGVFKGKPYFRCAEQSVRISGKTLCLADIRHPDKPSVTAFVYCEHCSTRTLT